MTDLRTAAQQALEAWDMGDLRVLGPKMAALRERLAQPERESVKFNCTVVDDAHPEGVPLSQWGRQPLTDEEIEDLYFDGFSISKLKAFARAIEAALKEKNNGLS